MDRTECFYKIDQLLNDRRSVSMGILIEELGVSRATIKRDLDYMKDRLNAPITWDRSLRGYRFDRSLPGAGKYGLPGLWFNDQEIFALLTMYQLLSNLGLFLESKNLARILFMDFLFRQIVSVQGVVMEFGTRWGQNVALFSGSATYSPFDQ